MAKATHKNNGLGARFWVPLLIMSLLTVGMGAWAIFEKTTNTRIVRDVDDNTIEIKLVRERNVVQDQQLLLFAQQAGGMQRQIDEALRLIKRHMGIPE